MAEFHGPARLRGAPGCWFLRPVTSGGFALRSAPFSRIALLTVIHPGRHLFVIVLLIAALTGCYTYRPIALEQTPRGAYVSAQLTDAGTAELGRLLGPSVVAVEGQLIDATTDQVSLSVKTTRQTNGVENFWTGETVDLPRLHVARVTERRFSRGRTALVGGSIAFALFGLWHGLDALGALPGSRGEPPGTR